MTLRSLPVRSVYAQAEAGVGSLFGAYVRGEAGLRPWDSFGVYAFGQWTPRDPAGTMAGLGARWTFDW